MPVNHVTPSAKFPPLKLIAKAPENRPKPQKRKGSYCNHPFSGEFAVSFREGIYISHFIFQKKKCGDKWSLSQPSHQKRRNKRPSFRLAHTWPNENPSSRIHGKLMNGPITTVLFFSNVWRNKKERTKTHLIGWKELENMEWCGIFLSHWNIFIPKTTSQTKTGIFKDENTKVWAGPTLGVRHHHSSCFSDMIRTYHLLLKTWI